MAFDQDALGHDDHRRLDVAVDARGAAQLHALGRAHVAGDLTADDDVPGVDVGLDDALLPDDERVVGTDLAGELAVQHDRAAERVLALDLRALVDVGGQVTGLGARLRVPREWPHGVRGLPRLAGAHLVDEIHGPPLAVVVDLLHVAVEEAALGDDERVGRDVAVHPARLGDLDVAGGGHVALVVAHDHGVDGLDVGIDDALLADDESPADLELPADLALDLDGIGDLELTLDLRGVAGDRQQRDGCSAVAAGLLRLRYGGLLSTEH